MQGERKGASRFGNSSRQRT